MIGRVIDNFKFVSEIGRGGMGVVYRAYDTRLDRFVAIKILKQSATDSIQFVQRFKREAKNQAQLSHPNVVPVYGFLEAEGHLGIVMEFMEGENLEHVIERKKKMDVYESIFIFKQVLKGLEYAHSKGFIHRDIKPSNIFISIEGHTKIMDFGISKSKFERGVTETGKNVGTLFYMSPEQIRGENPTIESDVYSLGVTLYEMLTGHVPFEAPTDYEIFEGHLKKEPPDMLKYSPELPSGIVGIVYKALQKKAAHRYHSLSDFYADLEDLENSLIHGYTPRKPIDKKNSSRRYKLKAITLTALILLTAAALVYFITSQVVNYWKSGKDFFALSGKQVTILDSIPAGSQKRLDCQILTSGVNNSLNSIYFINDSMGFACGEDGLILATYNSGSSWIKLESTTDKNLFSIFFNPDGRGFAVGENASVIRTENFGKSWKSIELNIPVHFFKVKFIDNFNGFILGDKGTILKTTDKGDNWNKVNTGSMSLLYDFEFLSVHSAFAVGWSGEIIKSSDGGDYWSKKDNFTSNYLKSIKFFSDKSGFAAGGSGDVFLTEDGGDTWVKQDLDFQEAFNDVQFIDNKIGFLCGSKGKVMVTLDGGKSWIKFELKSFATLNEMAVTPSGKIFAVGVNGTIIKL